MIFGWYRRLAAERQAARQAESESSAEARRRALEQLRHLSADDTARRAASAEAPPTSDPGGERVHRPEAP